jgi:hypothetical protein
MFEFQCFVDNCERVLFGYSTVISSGDKVRVKGDVYWTYPPSTFVVFRLFGSVWNTGLLSPSCSRLIHTLFHRLFQFYGSELVVGSDADGFFCGQHFFGLTSLFQITRIPYSVFVLIYDDRDMVGTR